MPPLADVHQAIVPLNHWKSLEEDGIRHRENSGIDANTDSQRDQGDRGRGGRAPHRPKPVADILRGRLEPWAECRAGQESDDEAHAGK